MIRIGHGYDSHRFEAGRPLILGGITIPSERGLAGHSDADAVAHAVTDALLGAAALGDIGTHFPPSDEEWRGADSMDLLVRIVRLIEAENYQVVNLDITVITEEPRLGPYTEAMGGRIAGVLGIAPGNVSVKAKTNEGLGSLGRSEGLAVHAVTLLSRIEDQDRLHARHAPDLPPL